MKTIELDNDMRASAARTHAQKNCLAVVLAIAQIVAPEVPPPLRERLKRLHDAARRALDLFNDDLQEVRIRSHRGAPASIDVEGLMKAVCADLRDLAEARNVALVMNCGGGALDGDGPSLREALFNLVSNAVEATPAGHPVYVDTAVGSDEDQLWVVTDVAGGMPAQLLERTGDLVPSTRVGGSGFGIALAKRVINDHGGTISFDSRAGEGTTVSIHLPRAR
jgi:signal transduction histidine kinase